jgi:maleate cis-trans isomerase
VSHLATWTEGESLALATERADRAEAKLEAAGVNVVDTEIGDPSPYQAVQDALLQRSFDTIIVSTLPLRSSRWLRMDLVHRLERTVAVPVIHVVAHSKA